MMIMSKQVFDKLSSEISIALYTTHPDYAVLASRICISNHQKKNVPDTFSKNVLIFYIIMVINLLLINIYMI